MLYGFIVGHGSFPSGLKSALELITGPNPNLMSMDTEGDENLREYRRRIQGKLEHIDPDKLILFTDLLGGSPYQNALVALEEMGLTDVPVFSGANLPMMVAFWEENVRDSQRKEAVFAIDRAGQTSMSRTTLAELSELWLKETEE